MGDGSTVLKAPLDPVAADRIWTDTVRKMTKSQIQVWPSRWNWLLEETDKMYDAMAGKRPFSPYDWSRWNRPPNPLPKLPTARRRGPDGKMGKAPPAIFLPPIPVAPRTTIPRTTSGWYGFVPKVHGRSLVEERQKWCKNTVGMTSLTRVFGWPDIFD